MRIRAQDPASLVSASGQTLLLDPSVLSLTPASRAWGEFASRDLFYAGFDENGTRGEQEATWASQGRLPRNVFAALTPAELSLLYPLEGGFELWARFPRARQDLAGLPSSTGLVVEWDPATSPASGWLPPHIPGIPERVLYFEGAFWVATAYGLTWLDFPSDRAAWIGYQGTRHAQGIDVGAQAPFGEDLDESLNLPGQVRGLAFRKRRLPEGGYAVHAMVLCHGGLVEVEYALTQSPRVLTSSVVDLPGFECSSGIWDSGRWLLFGARDGVLSGYQIVPGELPSPLRLPRLPTQSTTVQRDHWLWLSSDHGVLRSTTGDRWEFLAGIKRDELGIDPRYRSIDRCQRVADFAIERGVPAVLLHLTPEQGGGSMLNVFDASMRQIVYRRRYPKVASQLLPSPTPTVESRRVTPGRTPTPRLGIGPEDL